MYPGEEGNTKLLLFDTTKTELSAPTTFDALGTNVLWFEFDKAKKLVIRSVDLLNPN